VLPWAFTEHGAIMAANVLNSPRAIEVSIMGVRAFVHRWRVITTPEDLGGLIEQFEREFTHKSAEHDAHIQQIYALLDELMTPPNPPRKPRIGFATEAGS